MAGIRVANKVENNLDVNSRRSLKQRIAWVLLVIIVPVIALLIMAGVALQMIGVPVFSTTMKLVMGTTSLKSASQAQQLQQQLTSAKTTIQSLQQANQALQQKFAIELQKENSISSALAQAKQQFSTSAKTLNLARPEASIVKTMSAQSAAALLGKMTIAQAAAVVAEMSPVDAGPVLGAMDPTRASQILALSATLANQATANATTNTGATSTGGNLAGGITGTANLTG